MCVFVVVVSVLVCFHNFRVSLRSVDFFDIWFWVVFLFLCFFSLGGSGSPAYYFVGCVVVPPPAFSFLCLFVSCAAYFFDCVVCVVCCVCLAVVRICYLFVMFCL